MFEKLFKHPDSYILAEVPVVVASFFFVGESRDDSRFESQVARDLEGVIGAPNRYMEMVGKWLLCVLVPLQLLEGIQKNLLVETFDEQE